MKWTRIENGVYTAGPYRVERLVTRWQVSGPGVIGQTHDHKADAQAAAENAATARIEGQEATVEPVRGDLAYVPSWRGKDKRGRITTVIDNSSPNQQPIYCIRFNVGGGRSCRFRHEFKVILP